MDVRGNVADTFVCDVVYDPFIEFRIYFEKMLSCVGYAFSG